MEVEKHHISYLWHLFELIVRSQTLATVVIITAAKEEVSWSSQDTVFSILVKAKIKLLT